MKPFEIIQTWLTPPTDTMPCPPISGSPPLFWMADPPAWHVGPRLPLSCWCWPLAARGHWPGPSPTPFSTWHTALGTPLSLPTGHKRATASPPSLFAHHTLSPKEDHPTALPFSRCASRLLLAARESPTPHFSRPPPPQPPPFGERPTIGKNSFNQ